MSPKLTRIFGFFVLIAVALLLGAEVFDQPWLMYIFKPLAIALIFSISLANWKVHPSPFALWISIGLFLSLIGDIALMSQDRFFVSGLLAFLVAHICYLAAFSRGVKFPARPSVWLLYLTVLGSFYGFLFPGIPSALRLPVGFYVFFVASMAAQSMGRFLMLNNHPARLAALGTVLFLLSDALLSFDRFHAPIPAAAFFILTPYFLGQWLIALSTRPSLLRPQSEH
ncbi:MAG TPA: lysoplasmalogenase [Candidatus Acidoferrum sp.]